MSNSSPLHPADQRKKSNRAVVLMVAGIVGAAAILIAGVAVWSQYRVATLPISDREKLLLINAADVLEAIDPIRERDLLVRVEREQYAKRKYSDGMVELTYRYEADDPALQLAMEHSLRVFQTIEAAEVAFRKLCAEATAADIDNLADRYESSTINEHGQRTDIIIEREAERIAILKLSIADEEFQVVSADAIVAPLNHAFFAFSDYSATKETE